MRVVAVALVLVAHLIWQESPFVFGVPENLGPVINTSSFDGGPSLSADGLTLYLASARRGEVGGDDLWASIRRTQSDPWQPPVNLGSTVNSTAGEASPSISSNGLELYFDSGRPGGQGSADIWVTTRASTADAWGTPRNLGPIVNSASPDSVPKLSADGLSLFFASSRPGGLGMRDVWISTRPSRAEPWHAPINLGPAVNTPENEWCPGISPDGLTLIVNSTRPGGLGGEDLWLTTRATRSSPWGPLIHLDERINTPGEDAKPEFSADGSTLLFMSTRPGGHGFFDIWQVSLLKARREGEGRYMSPFRARVEKGRLVLNEPTTLPEGTVVDLVADDEGDDLTDEERRALHEVLSASWKSAEAGRLRPASAILDELRQQR